MVLPVILTCNRYVYPKRTYVRKTSATGAPCQVGVLVYVSLGFLWIPWKWMKLHTIEHVPDGSSRISGVLQAASVPLLDLKTCRQTHVYGSKSQQRILDSMICAGTLDGGIDACGGDSGGPLACKINGELLLHSLFYSSYCHLNNGAHSQLQDVSYSWE